MRDRVTNEEEQGGEKEKEQPAIIIAPYTSQHDIVGAELFGVSRGDRIRLDYTRDPFTRLTSGSLGTVQEFWSDDLKGPDGRHIWRMRVKWDSGSNLSLLYNIDRFTKVKKEEEQEQEE